MNDFWQENKRLVTFAGGGLLLFLIGILIVDGLYGTETRTKERSVARSASELRQVRYQGADRDQAEAENGALLDALEALSERAVFQPRPEFSLEGGSAQNASQRYVLELERVRLMLGTLAGRKRISLPQGLDLEMVATNSVDTLERHLAALDLLERALTLAIEYDVKQIRRIRVQLDSAFISRRGTGPIEETTVEIEAISTPASITDWLQATQTLAQGQVLPIRKVEARLAAAKFDELRASVTFSAVRLHLSDELAERVGERSTAQGRLD